MGCIFECPEPFYINGSECVSTCGDWFIDENRNCVETCPINTFYQEKLRLVQSGQYLERKCARCNDANQFVYYGSCVKVCPTDSRYIDGKSCTNKCPSERPFILNITLFTVVHHKCVEKCPHLVEDSSCRADCSGSKVIHNSMCINQCPSSSPFLFAKTCVNECPKYAHLTENGKNTCVNKCPDERPYVANSTCVERCPAVLPVFVSKWNPTCVETCGDYMYRVNGRCVYECPSSTVAVNDSCQEQCPTYAPFLCVIAKGLYCRQRPKNYFGNAMCVHECPLNMIIWNQTCMFSCPEKVPVFRDECTDECPLHFGNECTDECPIDYPLQRKVTALKDCNYGQTMCQTVKTVLTCVKDCPSNSVLHDNICLTYCPSHLLLEDNRCKSTCSASKPFITNAKVTETSWIYDRYYYRPYKQVKQDIVIYKCASSCGDDMVIWNSTCVSSCPENAQYVYNKTCSQQDCRKQYSEVTKTGTVCLEKCRDHQVIYNRTCSEACPETFKTFNGTCVEKCPESHFFIVSVTQGEMCDDYSQHCSAERIVKTCVEMCPDGLFIYKNTCIDFCPKPLFNLDKTCVEACPIVSPISESSSVTVETWAVHGTRFSKTSFKENIVKCVSVCPEGKAIYDSKCVDTCPVHLRYIINNTCVSETCSERYKYFSALGIRCFTECPEDLFVINDTCVLQCPDDMFAFGQTCVSECPTTHGFIHEETIGRNENNCTYPYFRENGYVCANTVIHVKKCLRRCPDNKFLYKNRCLEFCSNNSYTFNNTCVETCPMSHAFTLPAITRTLVWFDLNVEWYLSHVNNSVKICVVDCSEPYLQFRSECVKSCPSEDPFVFKNVCVDECPGDKLLDEATKMCVDKCARDKGLFNKTCYLKCPSKLKYIHNSECKAECPSSAPVALEKERFICRESCPDSGNLFNESGDCIYSFACDEPMFEYKGLCISKCLDGFVWFYECHDRMQAIIAIPGLALLFLVMFTCSWQTMKDCHQVFRLVFASEVCSPP